MSSPGTQEKPRRTSVLSLNIEFWDLTFMVPGPKGRKQVLKSISGHFRAGELSAILGPSGAGKSTLMNILMGTLHTNVTGSVLVNGKPRDMGTFNRQTTYIMQEDLVQHHLSVHESMMVVADLKMSNKCKRKEKLDRVDEILDMLDLSTCKNTHTEMLSGGQKKRLSVALELVSNPPVIFLDEPTTGLDSVATKQMLNVLKLLAEQGRTVVCSVHQPTASIFNQFDQVYVLARGQCVYQGEPRDLVPFLEDSGLYCPTTHNPADFILEAIQGENAENIILLAGEMLNGKLNWRPSLIERDPQCNVQPGNLDENVKISYDSSSLHQFNVLLWRMLRQRFRNKSALMLQVLYNFAVSFMVGAIYYQRGPNAEYTLMNFRYIMVVNVCFIYSNMIIPTLCFPSELKLVYREYLNRWYGLKAYFFAFSVANIPLQVFFGSIFAAIAYLMAGHPLEMSRLGLFALFSFGAGLISEGHGMVVGTLFRETNGAIVGPATMAPLLVMSVIGMGYGSYVEPYMAFVRSLSYIRYTLVGLTLAIFGMDRKSLECSSLYCHYKDPEILLRDLGMSGTSISMQFLFMVVFVVLYRIALLLALRYRLSLEFSVRLHALVYRMLRRKSSFQN